MPKKQDAKQQAALRMIYELGREASLIHTLGGRVAWVVSGLVWGIGLRRLGCVCGRRLGTGSRVSVRQTTNLVVRGLGVSLSVCLSVHEKVHELF